MSLIHELCAMTMLKPVIGINKLQNLHSIYSVDNFMAQIIHKIHCYTSLALIHDVIQSRTL